MHVQGSFRVGVISGHNLPVGDILSGTSDPYVAVRLVSEEGGAGGVPRKDQHGVPMLRRPKDRSKGKKSVARTTTKTGTLNPVWGEKHSLSLDTSHAMLILEVWDEDRQSLDELLGVCKVALRHIPADGTAHRLQLFLKTAEPDKDAEGLEAHRTHNKAGDGKFHIKAAGCISVVVSIQVRDVVLDVWEAGREHGQGIQREVEGGDTKDGRIAL